MRHQPYILATLAVATLMGCSGAPICCDGGYEYRHRNIVPVAEAKADDRDERIALLEKERQRQQAALVDLNEQVADLKRRLAAKPEPQPPLTKTYDDLLTLLKPEIDRGNIAVQRSGDQVTIQLADRLLFESGQDRLKPAGTEVLKKVGSVLHEVPDRHLQITGHTDNIPIGGRLLERFPNNTALSRARAVNALTALEEGGVAADHAAVEGYGETRPLASNMTEEGRRKNRRVEVVVLPKQAN